MKKNARPVQDTLQSSAGIEILLIFAIDAGSRFAMRVFPAIILALFVGGSMALFWGSYAYFRGEELNKAEARLSLYRSTVEAELKRFSHLTYILARDSVVIDTTRNGDSETLNTRFKAFAERAGIDAIFLMDTAGNTTSASNAGQPNSFVGPYFGPRDCDLVGGSLVFNFKNAWA